jgi:hypothetical protein
MKRKEEKEMHLKIFLLMIPGREQENLRQCHTGPPQMVFGLEIPSVPSRHLVFG